MRFEQRVTGERGQQPQPGLAEKNAGSRRRALQESDGREEKGSKPVRRAARAPVDAGIPRGVRRLPREMHAVRCRPGDGPRCGSAGATARERRVDRICRDFERPHAR